VKDDLALTLIIIKNLCNRKWESQQIFSETIASIAESALERNKDGYTPIAQLFEDVT
jgi:hypothetical protein